MDQMPKNTGLGKIVEVTMRVVQVARTCDACWLRACDDKEVQS